VQVQSQRAQNLVASIAPWAAARAPPSSWSTACAVTSSPATLIATLGLAARGAGAHLHETADAKAEIRARLDEAAKAKLPVLVVFGANWCGDCKMLDAAFRAAPAPR
jgi:thiol-disulfide isomerase/thioredoxin